MITTFPRIAAAALLAILGVGAVLLAVKTPRLYASAAPAATTSALPAIVSQLELSGAQRQQIDAIGAEEGPWVQRLQQAFAASSDDLGIAELAQPFDEALVAALVGRQAELAAYLRGAESRVVSRIVQVLTPEQRQRFADLRLARARRATLGSRQLNVTQRAEETES